MKDDQAGHRCFLIIIKIMPYTPEIAIPGQQKLRGQQELRGEQKLPWQLLLLVLLLWLGLLPQYAPAVAPLRVAAGQGEPAAALQQTLTALRWLPWRSDLWLQAARLAQQAGDLSRASAFYRRALQLSQDTLQEPRLLTVEDWLALGEIYLQSGEAAQARLAWQTGLERCGPSAALYQRLLQLALAQNDLSAAAHALEALIALEPEEAQYPYQLGLLLVAQKPQRALDYLQQAARLNPALQPSYLAVQRSLLSSRRSEEPAYRLLEVGRTLARLGEWELAAQAFWQATQLRPDYAEAWAYLGGARQQLAQGRPSATGATTPASDGLPELQTALALDPQLLSANAFLALYWSRQGRPDLALAAMQFTAARDPRNPVWQIELGNLLAQSGDLDAAYQHLSRAVQLSPYDPQPLLEVVRFALRYGYRLEEVALPAARQAVLLSQGSAESLTALGQALLLLSDLANAERFFQRALQAEPGLASAHLGLGLSLLYRGEMDAAFQEIRLAYQLATDSALAQQAARLAELYFPQRPFP